MNDFEDAYHWIQDSCRKSHCGINDDWWKLGIRCVGGASVFLLSASMVLRATSAFSKTDEQELTRLSRPLIGSPMELNLIAKQQDGEFDYYEILLLQRTATADDIRKAYRKVALKYHPDKNKGNTGAEDMFKKCSEAYEVLSNENLRRTYDQFGRAGLQSGGSHGFHGFGMHDAFSVFDNFFDGKNPFESFFGEESNGGFGGGSMFGSPFGGDDGFFGRSGGGSFTSASSSSFFGGFSGGSHTSTSSSQRTQTINGRTIRKTEKTVRNGDGSVQRSVCEEELVNGHWKTISNDQSSLPPSDCAGEQKALKGAKGRTDLPNR